MFKNTAIIQLNCLKTFKITSKIKIVLLNHNRKNIRDCFAKFMNNSKGVKVTRI